jgi:tetratricopeptide (TPR) repeat protein
MEFKRAIELDPNYPTAHHWYAHYLVVAGRFDEALNEIQLAHQLDPYSATINIWWGLIYYYQGQYERASAQLRSIVELDPGLRSAISNDLAQVYEQQGNDELAVEERQLAFSAAGRPQDGTAVAKAFTEGGPEAYWRERLILLQQTTHRGEARSLTLSTRPFAPSAARRDISLVGAGLSRALPVAKLYEAGASIRLVTRRTALREAGSSNRTADSAESGAIGRRHLLNRIVLRL